MTYTPQLIVSQEFFDVRSFKKNLPRFIADLKQFFTRDNDPTQEIAKAPHYSQVKATINKTSNMDLREIGIYVPAGLAVRYLDYLRPLSEGVDHSRRLLDEVLSPFARWLGEVINDPAKLQRISSSAAIRDFQPHNVEGTATDLGSCFRKGSNTNVVPFKNAFARNSDVKDVFEKTSKLADGFIGIERKKVLVKVNEISDNLAVLIKRIESSDESYAFSKESSELLSKLSYTLAREVEFYGTMAYQLSQLTTSLSDTAELLKPTGVERIKVKFPDLL